jgi:subtilisin family serine protease
MRRILILAFIIISGTLVQGQTYRYIIQLRDKIDTQYSLSNPRAYLSAKAIERRAKQHIPVDSTDLPVSAYYLQRIRENRNITILNVSKWLNQVLIETDPSSWLRVRAMRWVKNGFGVDDPNDHGPVSKSIPEEPVRMGVPPGQSARTTAVTALNYGSTFNQIHIHEGEYLHNLGFTGKGITIAILDAGFKSYKTNPVFDSVRLQGRVLGERDFVTNDGSVNEDDAHGAYCFSIIASNKPGTLVGSGPHASFWLLRTENTAGEFPVELQNWAVAAEFADSVGADMISCSLGYADGFTDPANNIPYAMRDGNTSIATIAADLAAKKGILVVNSAGNNGNFADDYKYVSCPADGDSVLTVGATDVNGNIASFSSWGPNGAGKLKPNIVSVGQATVLANTLGNVSTGVGTSFACPNAAGLIACLWQAFPEFTNMEVIDAVQKSASKYANPDFRFGYGIPNFHKAYDILKEQQVSRNIAASLTNQWIKVYPVPSNGTMHIVFKAPATGKTYIRLTDIIGNTLFQKSMDVITGQVYSVDFFVSSVAARGVYYLQYNDGKNKQVLPVLRR